MSARCQAGCLSANLNRVHIPATRLTTTALDAGVESHTPTEYPMTTRTRQASVTAYYLGRPAALWLAAFAPRPTSHNSSRGSFASKSQGLAAK